MINEKQNEIIKERDKSLIVSASAGSGKTFTMIERIFDLINYSHVNVNNMLVLTYTNSAATEMKQKLLNKLNEEIKKTSNKKFLQEQIDSLYNADISTFHSFYEKLIKKYYYKLNINPAFKILDETENDILKEKAFENAVKNFKESSDYYTLFSALNLKRRERPIKECVFKFYEFLTSIPNKAEWLKSDALKLVSNKNISEEILFEDFKNRLCYYKRLFEKFLTKSVNLGEDKLSAHINSIVSSLEEFLRADFAFAAANADLFKIERFVAPKNLDENFAQKIKDVKDGTKKCFKDFLTSIENFDKFEKNQENLKNIYNLFIEFYYVYEKELKKIKQEENKLDFSDIEVFALKLLEDEETLKEVKEKYSYIFVDEFQDVNKVQDQFVSLLAGENNLFLVGDPKQSIYAFRQSDVGLFLNRLNKTDEKTSVKNLVVNYRSDERILNFCNKIFSKLITTNSAEIDYKGTSMFESAKKFENEFKPVNLFLAKKEEKQETEEKTDVYKVFEADLAKEESIKEAEMITSEITNLLSKKIFDEKLNALREITYSDIAIIVRSRGNLSENLVKMFNKLNMPYVYNVARNLKEFKSVLALISAIKVASEYYSEIDYAVMLNRFFDISYNELAKIKLFNQDEKIIENAKNYNFDDEISKKLKIAEETLLKFKSKIEVDGIYFALNFLIANSNFNSFINTLDGEEEEKDAILEFLQFILNSNSDLISLISFVENSENLSVQTENFAADNKITITTIHSSKGLEYPIVFLSDLCKNLKNSKKDSLKIALNKDLGIYLNINEDETSKFINAAIKTLNYEQEFKENLRLLYVGTTRAQSALYLTGEISEFEFESLTAEDLKYCPQNFMAFILGALNQEELDNLKETGKIEDFNFKIFNSTEKCVAIKEEKQDVDFEQLKAINKIEYDFSNSKISQKTSVSEILKDEEYQLVCDNPKTFDFSEHLNFADEVNDIGSAAHKMLEILDFSASEKQIEEAFEECFKNLNSLKNIALKNEIISSCKWALGELKNISCGIIIKERKFMINASINEILSHGSNNKVLIQGIIDFASIGEKIVLVDYKYSGVKDERILKEKYKNQLAVYKFALQEFLHKNVDEVYIFNVKTKQKIKF